MTNQLPNGWTNTTLGEIAHWGSGGTPSRKNTEYYGGNVPWVKTGDLGCKILTRVDEFITQEAITNSSAKLFPKGSVALAMYGATIGKTSILGINATTNQACAVGQPIVGITFTDYLYYLILNERDNFVAKGKGGAQPNISQSLIKEHEIAFPPLAEQKEIATLLDNLLAQVDTLKTRLDAIPNILKRFRQSVLAAAVSGKLTEEWRKSEELIGWKNKKVLDVVKEKPRNGYSPKGVDYNTPYRNLTLSATTLGYFIEDKFKFIDIDIADDSYLWIKSGDILIQRANSLDYVGVSAIYKGAEKKYVYPDLMMKCEPNESILGEYLHYSLLSKKVRKYFHDNATGTAGNMPKINQQTVCSAPINLPPIEEQTEIVRRVEELFAFADQIEQRVKVAQQRVNHLTQAILAKAFRGELTAEWREQNPELISGENSAAALLARIQASNSNNVKTSRHSK
ncbi:4'-phosphopantetheinyl transferase [Thiothrix subterranea]|uniref:restriction endonuclease subunit S n=1 Tax=Thiothrix subterranea TaxID=2735563 RepID=UPI00192B0EB4|nr:restriction endonuclease subunit S [Thiothrix subterranea]QQZ29662.1 4'-phosphopantetheinyl transferase [Thiothrix subterranea]